MNDNWTKLWKLLTGSSLLGRALRTAIVYVVLLGAAYIVGLVNPAAGAWFTIILLLGNVAYLYRISEASWRFVKQQILPVLVTLVMAILLQQQLDYAFSLTFVLMLFARGVELKL